MKVTFLGGANEIGASCAVLDLEGIRVLVDSGQRMGTAPGEQLPDFSFLEDGPPISAVFLTHSHADHIGGLPALEPHLAEDCLVYGSEATIALTRVMLEDAIRIMVQHRQGDGELGLYPPATVRALLRRLRTVRWGKAIHPGSDKVWASWFPAGHILGAGMIEIRTRDESVLFSGDISIADQLSVPGAFVPAIRPQMLILESTYGNRLHAHRPSQEKRIVERVDQCVRAGGHVLFPTFALGRAQEVLILLGKAMREGTLTEVPVYADGLVRTICKTYARFPDDLSPWCRRLWEQGLDPILPEDLPIRAIRKNDNRETIAKSGPCVVVSSSGMLQGGASQFYASQWIGDPKNLILITGYQDEESPGQALLNLASLPTDQPRYFKLGGVNTEVGCQVESCQLSAHADNVELTSFTAKLQPHMVLLVHGDTNARESLAQSLMANCKATVILPENCDTYSPDASTIHPVNRPTASRPDPLAHWPPWDPIKPRDLDLDRFHQWLASHDPPLKWITLEELAEVWRSPEVPTAEDWQKLREAVYERPQPYFVPDGKRPYILRIQPRENIERATVQRVRLDVALSTNLMRDLFPVSSGLRRFGFFPEEGAVELDFQFPLAAERRYTQRLGEFLERTGWEPRIKGTTNDEDLIAQVRELCPTDDSPAISVQHQPPIVEVTLPTGLEIDMDEVREKFQHRTGYQLELRQLSN